MTIQTKLILIFLAIVNSYNLNLKTLSCNKRISEPLMQTKEYMKDSYKRTWYDSNRSSRLNFNQDIRSNSEILLQGDALRTWSFKSPFIDQVQVFLSSEGRPIDTDIELWQGPDNTPFKMRVYNQDGFLMPFNAIIETPRGPNTIAVKNLGQLEFPIIANVISSNIINPSVECLSSFSTIQGGALRTYPFDPFVDSIQILLKTDGRPLNARIELLQGPNNNKQIVELYSEDGCDRPMFCILKTPGPGNVIRIINTSPIEFPMYSSVVPNSLNNDSYYN